MESALTWVRDHPFATTGEKGDALEQFVALVGIPRLFAGATAIEWLGKGQDSLGYGQDRADVRFTWNGEVYFVQCKNYADPIGEQEANAYRTAFEDRRGAGYTRLMIVALGGFSNDAKRSLGSVDAEMYCYEDLLDADVSLAVFQGLIKAQTALDNPVLPPRKPRPHQKRAISALLATQEPRNLIVQATGSGKTFVQAMVIKGLQPDLVLVLVPNIELVRQQMRSYNRDLAGDYKLLGVCSGNDRDLPTGIRMTTNPARVAAFLAGPGRKIVVSTYQSVENVIMPCTQGYTFDLIIFDEAHRTASMGSDVSTFSAALHDQYVMGKRRDFYTATPRTASAQFLAAASHKNYTLRVHSMDDPMIFGPQLAGATFTLTQAIKAKVVSSFDVHVGIIGNQQIRDLVYAMTGKRQVNYYTDLFGTPGDPDTYHSLTDVAQALMFLQHCKPGESYLTFHGAGGKHIRMRQLLERLAADMGIPATVMAVDNTSSPRRRREAIQLLADKNPRAVHIVTNCRLFQEGVDVPSLDGVCFFDPKQTTVGIGQAVGRALRYVKGKRAKVILPIFVEDVVDAEDFVRNSRYANMFTIPTALRDLNVVLSDPVYTMSETATPITSRSIPRVGVYITVPTAYSHPMMLASISNLVIQGTVALTDPEIVDLVVQFKQNNARLPSTRTKDKNEAKLARAMNAVAKKRRLRAPAPIVSGDDAAA